MRKKAPVNVPTFKFVKYMIECHGKNVMQTMSKSIWQKI